MSRPSRVAACAVLCAGLAAACGTERAPSLLDQDTLVAGIRPDLPGLGLRRADGSFEGLDVDVARYVAAALGKRVAFIGVKAADRIPALLDGRADLILATLSVTPERKTRIAFAGPYYNSFQDVLVRTDERGVDGVRDLKGRRFCSVTGSDTAQRMLALPGMTARIVPAPDYGRCTALITSRKVDAITTNDVILAGLVRRTPGLRLLGARISEQNTGIGLRRGDPDGCEALNRAITRMYQDGTAARLTRKWFGGTGLDRDTVEVPQFEGCL
ncbi:transporter substrate-binding domain-containing protein [Actinomadura parmotrematis]|uniref:Transporter substrate-binding domain-containing protein n=1 Tax=Actinomadura parmotrematis TaxID=2864039 RepID=A0ABS7FUI7_9ACTN|nr:transporter substrate-binding domain-containing protein [Actinomadura parmotrematis]MBW8484069.1 transporter substrate-binding domain-containing protein [Actinomadura parmotrematis]